MPRIRQERIGGREKGTPNQVQVFKPSDPLEPTEIIPLKSLKPAIRTLQEGMEKYLKLAEEVPADNKPEFVLYYDKAMKLAAELAPYQSPRIQAVFAQNDQGGNVRINNTLVIKFV